MPPLRAALDRRAALRILAAGAATAMAGCQRPAETIVPWVEQPDGDTPGRARLYATSIALGGYGRGVTARVVDGRPIKLEGLAAHPASLGATDVFTEAAILDLYDPQRLKAIGSPQGVAGWGALERVLADRLARSDGRGLRLLTGRITSPTLLARIAQVQTRFPAMRHVRWEPIGDDAERAGAALAFGRPLTMRSRLAEADTIVALDADPLGPGPDQVAFARAWSERRRRGGGVLLAIEPALTLTGAMADGRAACHPMLMGDVARAIAAGLGQGVRPALPPEVAAVVDRVARRLRTGKAVLLVGRDQPAEVHALAAWINMAVGAPVDWIAPVDPAPEPHRAGLATLMREMQEGAVNTLVILDADPVHAAPGFTAALAHVPFTLAAAVSPSATTARCQWTAPLHHSLESWGDLRATDGAASLVQPLIRPLYDTRSPLGFLDLLDQPAVPIADREQVRRTWAPQAGGDPDRWWRDTLAAGVIAGTAATPVTPGAARLVLPQPAPLMLPLVLTTPPSATLWDGRHGANPWLQEAPDPLTKEVWGASARMHPDDAARLGLKEGDSLVLANGVAAAVRIDGAQAKGVVTLPLGHGRRESGTIADALGANAFAVPQGADGWRRIVLHAGGDAKPPPTTQHQFALDGDLARLFPVLAPGAAMPAPEPLPSLLPAPPPRTSPAWAMAIDTSVCIGCNACVVACQAENNVPSIGADQIARGRDMHWLRVDRYDVPAGAGGETTGFQPVPCMQCEEAPCEPVCPVEASVHDHQGLNVQVYNRCIGTRTCQANCPYKVRRFNFLDYAEHGPWEGEAAQSATAQRNPDVTVRTRGVMEKCTYCVQRIEQAVHDADANGTAIRDGAVVPACASACPTRAIVFGDMADANAQVSAAKRDPRHYALLGELGTRPRTTYLARVREEG